MCVGKQDRQHRVEGRKGDDALQQHDIERRQGAVAQPDQILDIGVVAGRHIDARPERRKNEENRRRHHQGQGRVDQQLGIAVIAAGP